jgi:hypothetical protein
MGAEACPRNDWPLHCDLLGSPAPPSCEREAPPGGWGPEALEGLAFPVLPGSFQRRVWSSLKFDVQAVSRVPAAAIMVAEIVRPRG